MVGAYDSVVVVVDFGSGVVVVSGIGVVANENHQLEVGNQVTGLMVLGTSFGLMYLTKKIILKKKYSFN